MRILHVVSTLSRAGGGISVAVSEWCGHLAASGVEVLLLTREEAEEELVSIPPGVDLAAVSTTLSESSIPVFFSGP